ncbi:DoxX family protein [Aquimarina sp. 2201CG1-2-11]|uniref:DoxX family protein n=1 Tax=Aquimarina discodermiae TaxID=3231043 RepID=UPI00346230B0
MKKTDVWIYRIVTILFTLLISFGAIMYFVQYEMVSETILKLGFPTFIIYPLAILKILGLIAIWTNKSLMLKEWAYAGFVFELLLAIGAHITIKDGEYFGALIALTLVILSYIYNRKLSKNMPINR